MNILTKETFIFGSQNFDYSIEFSSRKTLEIAVNPDSSVIIKAPFDTKEEILNEKIKKRAYWILKQKEYFNSFSNITVKNKYMSGGSLYYLGKQYRLKIIEAKHEEVKLFRGFIYVYTKNKKDNEVIEKLLDSWYLEHAKKYFSKLLLKQYEKIRKYDVLLPELKVRKLAKRWGSCTKDSKIILNIELIKVSSLCIEYVIMHELCHLKYYSHDKKYYDFLELLMPDWKKRKNKLENYWD